MGHPVLALGVDVTRHNRATCAIVYVTHGYAD